MTTIKPGDTVIRCGSAFSHPRVVKEIRGKFAHFKGGGLWRLDCLRKCAEVVDNSGESCDISHKVGDNKKRPTSAETDRGPVSSARPWRVNAS